MSKDSEARWKSGLDILEKVYGPGSSAMMKGGEHSAFTSETVSHLFGDIWSRPALSMRDKRLLILGATAMLGRQDLVETQVGGALANGEFTDEQLEDIALLLLYYVGAGNSTALYRGIMAAKAKAAAKSG